MNNISQIYWYYLFMVSQAAPSCHACQDLQTKLFFLPHQNLDVILFHPLKTGFSRFRFSNLFKENFRFNHEALFSCTAKSFFIFSKATNSTLKWDMRQRWWIAWNKIKFLLVDREFFCHFSPHSHENGKTKDAEDEGKNSCWNSSALA